ncbi:hypothetical protein LAUMK4_05119 [Mycobacterium persicum]|uniref:Uncharacterized protein n=1 Tax=Mycobacterium persicum TaxID=1487726 RepID=A0ABY6RQT8_9MYCO|nr:hypothetical protein LAUMK22_05047 [Mycobacterium kansasii]VAZ80742.1 hypothetical protein LAUMK15_05517 [Mycobacterium persicum]VBA30501.1 hypothetical protein LAUMK4_05119 [Mycobacterium persicum]
MSEYSTDRASQPRDNAVASGSDSAPGHVRLTKSRRGTRAAGLALGALAITSGVSGVLDVSTATTNGPNVSVGRLAITLTANHGFKLDTCTAGNSGIAQGDNTNSGNSSNIDSSDGTGATTATPPVIPSPLQTLIPLWALIFKKFRQTSLQATSPQKTWILRRPILTPKWATIITTTMPRRRLGSCGQMGFRDGLICRHLILMILMTTKRVFPN